MVMNGDGTLIISNLNSKSAVVENIISQSRINSIKIAGLLLQFSKIGKCY